MGSLLLFGWMRERGRGQMETDEWTLGPQQPVMSPEGDGLQIQEVGIEKGISSEKSTR